MAQSKLEMILELKDRFSTALTRAKKRMRGDIDDIRNRMRELKASTVKAFSAMKDEIPGLDRAVRLLRNPFVLASAAAVGFFSLAGQAVGETAKFNREFLSIRQLNLDKSKSELSSYQSLIKDTAFRNGTDLALTTQAFYDVQSATGKFGKEAELVVDKVSRFSVATGANLTDSINSTVKAMRAFGLGASDIDGYLQSNAKTVQLGITTFDQLAKVQTEYAGSAASTGQSIDTANKLFATFTTLAKNADIGAGKTATALNGLTSASAVKGLKEIGVNVFDSTGKARKLDNVIEDLVPKIEKMSDAEFSTLREEIGGPVGLTELLSSLKESGREVIDTFQKFDKIQFSLDDALANAKGDFTTLKSIVGNQLNIVLADLGQAILPSLARGLQMASTSISWLRENSDTIISTLKALGGGLLVLKSQAVFTFGTWAVQTGLASLSSLGFAGSLKAIGTAIYSIPIIGWVAAGVTGLILLYEHSETFRAAIAGVGKTFSDMLPIFKSAARMISAMLEGDWDKVGIIWDKGLKKSFSEYSMKSSFLLGASDHLSESKAATAKASAPTTLDNNKLTELLDEDNKLTDDNKKPIAPATPVQASSKSITINIEALHRGDNLLSTTRQEVGESLADFEQKMEQVFLRLIRNVETTV